MITHQKQWDFLKGKFEANQLSHAYVFSGPEGIGKKCFAIEFTKLINDKTVARFDLAIEKEAYPDLSVVKSINSKSSLDNEKDMMEIDVGQMRQLNNFLSYKSYYGGYKTVIIENAERMNQEAQNCLLKTLEEPKGKTIIILITKNTELLLSTIASRCQVISFLPANQQPRSKAEEIMLKELLPLISSELATKFQYAKKVNLEGENFNNILKALQGYFRNLMLAKIGVLPQPASLQFNNYPVEKIKNIICLIERLHTQAMLHNINTKLALEILLIEIS